MYYSRLGFEIVFYSPCNITDVVYRGWASGRGWSGWSGWVASRRRAKPAIRVHRVVLSPQLVTDMYTTHRMDQDRHCQQFHTIPTLISAPQWPHRPCNAPMWLYTVSKKLSVKADLAMHSQTVDVSR